MVSKLAMEVYALFFSRLWQWRSLFLGWILAGRVDMDFDCIARDTQLCAGSRPANGRSVAPSVAPWKGW
jgi:hypothetical protein